MGRLGSVPVILLAKCELIHVGESSLGREIGHATSQIQTIYSSPITAHPHIVASPSTMLLHQIYLLWQMFLGGLACMAKLWASRQCGKVCAPLAV